MAENLTPTGDNSDVRLLVVDDEPNIRTPLARALGLRGYLVEEADSGHEALRLLERTPYNLMVLDMHMPGMDGAEVIQHTRRLYPKMLIIILTGYNTLDNAIAAIKGEAVDYLLKPVSMEEILAAVAQALQKRLQRCE